MPSVAAPFLARARWPSRFAAEASANSRRILFNAIPAAGSCRRCCASPRLAPVGRRPTAIVRPFRRARRSVPSCRLRTSRRQGERRTRRRARPRLRRRLSRRRPGGGAEDDQQDRVGGDGDDPADDRGRYSGTGGAGGGFHPPPAVGSQPGPGGAVSVPGEQCRGQSWVPAFE